LRQFFSVEERTLPKMVLRDSCSAQKQRILEDLYKDRS
jgi:hypothetical protein